MHVQTHSVPAPFTADVSTAPSKVAYDAEGHAFDTNTKLDKQQARAHCLLPPCAVLPRPGLADYACSTLELPSFSDSSAVKQLSESVQLLYCCVWGAQKANSEHFLNQVFSPRASSEGAKVLAPCQTPAYKQGAIIM